jgi:hypothetical protein
MGRSVIIFSSFTGTLIMLFLCRRLDFETNPNGVLERVSDSVQRAVYQIIVAISI